MQQNDLAIPTLPSRALANTLGFYERLGFEGRILGAGDAYAILTDKPWGMREFAVVDDDGNLLRIGQEL